MAPLPPPALPFPKGAEGAEEQEGKQQQQRQPGRHHNNDNINAASSTSSASASSESESSSSLPLPSSAGAPFPVSAGSAPPLLTSASCLPTIPTQQQHPLLHFQNQFQQQRLLSLHLSSTSSSPPPPPPPPTHSSHVNSKPLSALPPLLPPPSSLPASDPSPVAPPAAPAQHSRDDCWSEGATLTLIQAWGDRYLELNRGNLKQKHWKDVADCVNRRANGSKASKTDVQCKNRLDTLKKKYKLEKSKIVTGGGPSKWAFFERLDDLIGPNKKTNSNTSKKHPTTPTTTTNIIAPIPIPIPAPMPAHPSVPSTCTTSIYPPISTPTVVPVTCGNNTVAVNTITTTTTTATATGNNNILLSAPAAPSFLASNKRPLEEIDLKHKTSFFPPFPQIPDTTDIVSKSKESPDMADSCPNGLHQLPLDGKVPKRKKSEDSPFKELARAILKFGEVYERIETAKQQQLVDLEKQRMEFTKDLELQRLQLFMQTQVELAKLKHGRKPDNNDHYL